MIMTLKKKTADNNVAPPLVSPGGMRTRVRWVEIDGVFAATLTITGYPAEVLPGWLETLYTYPARVDVAIHGLPVPPVVAARRLRRARARLESGRRIDYDRGKLDDPHIEAA